MNKTNDQLVSIMLPVTNAALFLHECLKSLKRQTYTNLEIIAIDDKSTDDSYKILVKWKKKDARLRVYHNKKRYGLAVCLNRSLKHARGRYVAFMHPKDSSSPLRLARQTSFLIKNTKTVAIGTQCTFINEKGKRTGKSSFPTQHAAIGNVLLPGHSLQPETIVIDRKRLPKDILYFKPITYPFLYSEVLLKIMRYGQLTNLSVALYHHRQQKTASERNIKFLLSHAKVWFNAAFAQGKRPPLSSLFMPLLKQT